MLPSRGISRCLPVGRAHSQNLFAYPLAARQFGTAVRSNGGNFSRLPARASGGSRLAGASMASAAGVMFAPGRLAFQSPKQQHSMLQVRHASSTPHVETPSGLESGVTPPLADPTPLVDGLDGSALLNMTEQLGFLKAMGIEFGWGPTSMVQWALEHLHVYTGLPWWASIAAFAVLVRFALLPTAIQGMASAEKLRLLRENPKFKQAMDNMMSSFRNPNSNTPAARLEMMQNRKLMKQMQRDAGVSTWKSFVPMALQLPLGIGFFRLMHAVCAVPIPGFETQGVLWFTNLTVADPFFIMPLVSSALLYSVLNSSLKMTTDPQQAATLKTMQYILVPISTLVTLKLSAAIQLYILCTSIFQVMQTWVLNKPNMRRRMGLPPLRPNGAAAPPAARGGTWHPPRTIMTTASAVRKNSSGASGAAESSAGSSPESKSAADIAGINTNNPLTNMKNALSGARNQLNSFTEKGRVKRDAAKADSINKRRAEEDREKFHANRKEHLRKLQERNGRRNGGGADDQS